MTAKKTYGIALRGPNKGRLTECNAKDPNTCNFHKHGSHESMTEEEYQESVEKMAQESRKTGSSLSKKTASASSNPRPRTIGATQRPALRLLTLSGDELNSFISSKAKLTTQDIDKIHDDYFYGIRPIQGWSNTENIYYHKVYQSRIDSGTPADEYVTTFKNSEDDRMYLTIQRDSIGGVLSSMMEIDKTDSSGSCVVDIPRTHSGKSDYEKIWKTIDSHPTPVNMKRELVVVPGGSMIGLDTPVDRGDGRPGVPRLVRL